MHHFSIPTCYFPSTVLFIDDNRDFLLNFVLQLDEWLAYRLFDSPFDALNLIQKKQDGGLFHQRCLNYANASLNKVAEQQFLAIWAEIYNGQRFSDISVVVVDYAMPGMDGLEFCRRLQQLPIKKILLTGKADEKLAIDAFNQGLIDRYIHKNDPEVASLITQSIDELQWQYFQDISERLIRSLSLSSPHCLHDQPFSHFFKQFCKQHHVVEFYLCDQTGSFLLLDVDANPSFFVLKNHLELAAYEATMIAQSADAMLIKAVRNKEKMPLALSHTPCNQIHDWIVASHLKGENCDYYYAHSKNAPLLSIRADAVHSYHHHLQEVDAEELLDV